MSEDHDGPIYERALMIAVEARTMARQAHERQDAMDSQITAIRDDLADFKAMVAQRFADIGEALAKLNTKVAMAAAFGAVVASFVSALLIHYIS